MSFLQVHPSLHALVPINELCAVVIMHFLAIGNDQEPEEHHGFVSSPDVFDAG